MTTSVGKMAKTTTGSARSAGPSGDAPTSTGSFRTTLLGAACLVGLAVLGVFAFVLSDPDTRVDPVTGAEVGQFDTVRLMYVHVPMAILTYVAFACTAVGSVAVLWKRSRWWDTVAYASAEIGTLFCALTLVTGSIWGRPTWNTWWEWSDVRLVTTLILFLLFVGYLAFRRLPADPDVRRRRAAVIALVAAINIPIVNRSVEWWESRTLHQKSSLTEGKLEDLTLFTLFLGIGVFSLVFVWLLIHRFRVGWLEEEVERQGLGAALAERRAEAEVGVDAAIASHDGPVRAVPEVKP